MSLDALIKKIEQQLQFAPAIGYKVKLDLGDDGIIFIDGTEKPAQFFDSDQGEADTTLITSIDVFQAIASGTKDPNMAVMMGKMKVEGSTGVALKLAALLED